MVPEHTGFMCIAVDCDNETDGPGVECGRCRYWTDLHNAIARATRGAEKGEE